MSEYDPRPRVLAARIAWQRRWLKLLAKLLSESATTNT